MFDGFPIQLSKPPVFAAEEQCRMLSGAPGGLRVPAAGEHRQGSCGKLPGLPGKR